MKPLCVLALLLVTGVRRPRPARIRFEEIGESGRGTLHASHAQIHRPERRRARHVHRRAAPPRRWRTMTVTAIDDLFLTDSDTGRPNRLLRNERPLRQAGVYRRRRGRRASAAATIRSLHRRRCALARRRQRRPAGSAGGALRHAAPLSQRGEGEVPRRLRRVGSQQIRQHHRRASPSTTTTTAASISCSATTSRRST